MVEKRDKFCVYAETADYDIENRVESLKCAIDEKYRSFLEHSKQEKENLIQ